MGRNKRETLLIERRRREVAELYLQGNQQSEIAVQLGVSQGTVSNDIRAIRRQWKEATNRDFEEATALELAKLQQLEQEAWKGWQKSFDPIETTKVTQDGGNKRAEKTVRQQHGDPRFLEQVQRCIRGRRALLGLDAPTRIAPTSPDGEESYHIHVMNELMKLAEETEVGPTVVDGKYIEQQIEQAIAAQYQTDKECNDETE